jgi:hypothetical protein
MPTSIITRPIGPTYIISATSVQSVPIGVRSSMNEPMNYAEFLNGNTTSSVCITVAPLPANGIATTAALVFPNATSQPTAPNSFMLGPAMKDPRVVPVPANGFSVSAIVASGTSTVFITPVSVM